MRGVLSSFDNSERDEPCEENYPPPLPPRLLKCTRLFLPYGYGWIEIGLLPTSDGYGNANVSVVVNIIYGNEWLSLNEIQLAEFFITLREIESYHDGQCYFNRTEDSLIGKFYINKFDDFFKIVFAAEEGDQYIISHFMVDDIIPLLKMEKMIDGKIQAIAITMRDVIGVMEQTALKYRDNAEKIKDLAENWHCDDIIFEIAVNYFHFFVDFVDEINKNDVDEH